MESSSGANSSPLAASGGLGVWGLDAVEAECGAFLPSVDFAVSRGSWAHNSHGKNGGGGL